MRAHGDRLALVDGTRQVDHTELAGSVQRTASLLDHGRSLVAVEAANRLDAVVAYLGALAGGHAVLLLPERVEAAELLLDRYRPSAVLTAETEWMPERVLGGGAPLHPDLAVALSTSGSTGSPKLVRLSHRNLATNAAAIADYLRLDGDDVAITTLPMQYCYGLSVLHSHLVVGGSVVLNDASVVDPCFRTLAERHRVTTLAGVPHTFELLERIGGAAALPRSIRRVTQAGGRMEPARVRALAAAGREQGFELYVMYGQTEATARMAYLPPALAESHPERIGIAIPGGRLWVDEPDADGVGELVYAGPNVMLGYAESADDLALGRAVDELRTGDLARAHDDGTFAIVGRRSRFVKPGGLRIDLDRLEAHLADRGFAAWCTGDDERVVVGTTADVDATREALAPVLDLPVRRVTVIALHDLPRLPNGKPDRTALLGLVDPAEAGDGDDGTVLERIRSIHRSVLGVAPSDDQSFVDVGGDSLSYVEVSVRLEALLGSLPTDWHLRPIGSLAASRSRPGRRRIAWTETTVVLRAVAIVAIVGTHAGWFHRPFGARMAVPAIAWISVVAALGDRYGWPNALLVHNVVEREGDAWGYWFIEALIWLLLGLATVLAVPGVARFRARHPLGGPLAVAGLGLLFRFDVIATEATFGTVRPHEVLWLFALGWAAAEARRMPSRALVVSLAAVGLHDWFGDPTRECLILAGIGLLTFFPRLPVPRIALPATSRLASASLWIYLVHYQVFPVVDRWQGPVAATVASLVAGVAAERTVATGQVAVVAQLARRRARRTVSSTWWEADAAPGGRAMRSWRSSTQPSTPSTAAATSSAPT